MHWREVSLLAAALCAVGWLWLTRPVLAPAPLPPVADPVPDRLPIAWKAEPPASIENAAQAVFKRAFWRRPEADDHILHAVRHEWHDADGVSRWQWFLIVDPSPGLLQYLREKNVFSLVPGYNEVLPEAPAWFVYDSDAVDPWHTMDGRMQILFRHADDRIFACAAGAGFNKAVVAPSAVPPINTGTSRGRLPNVSPPTPVQAGADSAMLPE